MDCVGFGLYCVVLCDRGGGRMKGKRALGTGLDWTGWGVRAHYNSTEFYFSLENEDLVWVFSVGGLLV